MRCSTVRTASCAGTGTPVRPTCIVSNRSLVRALLTYRDVAADVADAREATLAERLGYLECGRELLVRHEPRERRCPARAVEQQREVGRDLGVELRDVLVWMSVVVGPLVRSAVPPDEVVFRVRMDHIQLGNHEPLRDAKRQLAHLVQVRVWELEVSL